MWDSPNIYIYICEKLDVMILLDDESELRVSVDDKLLFNYHSCISDLSQFYVVLFFQIEIVILTKLIREDNRFINQDFSGSSIVI